MAYNTPRPMISTDELMELLEDVVASNEDFVYQYPMTYKDGDVACLYVDDSDPEELKPSCGIGHLFHNAGVSLQVLKSEWEDTLASTVAREVFHITEGDEYTFSEALYILDRFQMRQDDGLTWGVSLEWAIRDYENKMAKGPRSLSI